MLKKLWKSLGTMVQGKVLLIFSFDIHTFPIAQIHKQDEMRKSLPFTTFWLPCYHSPQITLVLTVSYVFLQS